MEEEEEEEEGFISPFDRRGGWACEEGLPICIIAGDLRDEYGFDEGGGESTRDRSYVLCFLTCPFVSRSVGSVTL